MVRSLEDGEEISRSAATARKEDAYGERVYWSPDSTADRRCAHAGRERSTRSHMVESSPKDQLQPKLHSLEYRKPGDRVPVAKPQLFDVIAQRQIPGE